MRSERRSRSPASVAECTARRAGEQAYAEPLLQLADGMAQCGRGDADLRGGAGEAALARNVKATRSLIVSRGIIESCSLVHAHLASNGSTLYLLNRCGIEEDGHDPETRRIAALAKPLNISPAMSASTRSTARRSRRASCASVTSNLARGPPGIPIRLARPCSSPRARAGPNARRGRRDPRRRRHLVPAGHGIGMERLRPRP